MKMIVETMNVGKDCEININFEESVLSVQEDGNEDGVIANNKVTKSFNLLKILKEFNLLSMIRVYDVTENKTMLASERSGNNARELVITGTELMSEETTYGVIMALRHAAFVTGLEYQGAM